MKGFEKNKLKKLIILFALSINSFFLTILLVDKPFYINSLEEYLIGLILILLIYITLFCEYFFKKSVLSAILVIVGSCNFIIADIIASNSEFVSRKRKLPILAKRAGIYFDKRSLFEFINEINKTSSEKYFPNVSPGIITSKKRFKSLPLSNISNAWIAYCNESGKRVTYKSNKFGFRSNNLKDNNGKPYGNKKSVYMIGDSFTQGGCVENEYTFENQLGMKFPKFKFISFGKGGTSLGYQYAIFKEYIFNRIENGDSLIIFHYPINDYLEIRSEYQNNNILRNYYSDNFFSQNLNSKKNNHEKDLILKEFISKNFKPQKKSSKLISSLKLENLLLLYFNTNSGNMKKKRIEGIKIYANYLNKISTDLASKKITINLVCIPSFKDFGSNVDNSTCHEGFAELIPLVENNNINFVIPNDEFIEKSNHQIIFPFGNQFTHFNNEGYINFINSIYSKLNF